ncbi:hypothetical protein G7Y89_g6463 [Cudoniella acicularis]|uniref:ATPase AAA-type core domain-containing protein n=1 Tax=Cudoniella acicularis TaxID=354080 RepID=A0A8H4RLW2_9HELO|nr:hypothetical protein G7Y89_g6463 [Cudoniella acicularis]
MPLCNIPDLLIFDERLGTRRLRQHPIIYMADSTMDTTTEAIEDSRPSFGNTSSPEGSMTRPGSPGSDSGISSSAAPVLDQRLEALENEVEELRAMVAKLVANPPAGGSRDAETGNKNPGVSDGHPPQRDYKQDSPYLEAEKPKTASFMDTPRPFLPQKLPCIDKATRTFAVKPLITIIPEDEWPRSRSGRTIPATTCLVVSVSRDVYSQLDKDISISSSSYTVLPGSLKYRSLTPFNGPVIPERLAIGSFALLHEIGSITGLKMRHPTNVFLSPFKIFVTYADKFRQHLVNLEERCNDLNSGSLEAQTEEKPEKAKLTLESPDGERKDKPQGANDPSEEPASDTSLASGKSTELRHALALRDELRCLVSFIDDYLVDIWTLGRHLQNREIDAISFDQLWHLFSPGDLVISQNPFLDAFIVLHVTGGRRVLSADNIRTASPPPSRFLMDTPQQLASRNRFTPFIVDCVCWDCDGKALGPVFKYFIIPPYEGEQAIQKLPIYPVEFGEAETSEKLMQRGRLYFDLVRNYGKAWRYRGPNLHEATLVEGHEQLDIEVVIDLNLRFCYWKPGNKHEAPVLNKRVKAPRPDKRETYGAPSEAGNFDDSVIDLKRKDDFISSKGIELLEKTSLVQEGLELSRNQYSILPASIFGYSLFKYLQYNMKVENLVPSYDVPSFETIDFLVLPQGHKDILKAVMATNSDKSEPGTSLKTTGSGVIVLLHGAPEAIARSSKCSLFRMISPGRMDIPEVKDLTKAFGHHLNLAQRWGSIVLIEDADVYLANRRSGRIADNSLVSAFIKALDSYPGITFLTTNRVGDIDEAVKSRIHVSLYFPPLDRQSTLQVWKLNYERTISENDDIRCNADEILDFSKDHWREGYRWNGHQIKNAFTTAVSLARWEARERGKGKRHVSIW